MTAMLTRIYPSLPWRRSEMSGKVQYPSRTNPLTATTLPPRSFLSDAIVYQVKEDGQICDSVGAAIEQLAFAAIESGSAEISTDHSVVTADSVAAMAIPIHRCGKIVSVVVLSARGCSEDQDDKVGVFEVWEPVGVYEELALKVGYFGKMDRFQNVSSFVRFEKDTGLPGQVWQQRTGVIHDDLSNHPGFLRAAGTSADLLVTAIGIPVASSTYHSTAVLISSHVSPIARGFEVWQVDAESFLFMGGAYRDLGEGVQLPLGAVLPLDSGLPGLASSNGGAVLCEDIGTIFSGRNHDAVLPETACGLAIPFYEGDKLVSVTALIL